MGRGGERRTYRITSHARDASLRTKSVVNIDHNHRLPRRRHRRCSRGGFPFPPRLFGGWFLSCIPTILILLLPKLLLHIPPPLSKLPLHITVIPFPLPPPPAIPTIRRSLPRPSFPLLLSVPPLQPPLIPIIIILISRFLLPAKPTARLPRSVVVSSSRGSASGAVSATRRRRRRGRVGGFSGRWWWWGAAPCAIWFGAVREGHSAGVRGRRAVAGS